MRVLLVWLCLIVLSWLTSQAHLYYVWMSPTVVLFATMAYGFFAFVLGMWFEQRAQSEREWEYRKSFEVGGNAAIIAEGSAEARSLGIGVDYSAGSSAIIAEPCGSTEQELARWRNAARLAADNIRNDPDRKLPC